MLKPVALGVGWVLVIISSLASAAEMTQIMREELERSMAVLTKEPSPAYFLSYEIVDQEEITLEANLGALTLNTALRSRQLDVDVRVGSHELDNTRQILTGSQSSTPSVADFLPRFGVPVPIDMDPLAIKTALWRQTDQEYREASAQLTRVKANQRVSAETTDASPDFSKEQPQQYAAAAATIGLDRGAWADKVRRLSAAFARYGFVHRGAVSIRATRVIRWYVNSEGTVVEDSFPSYALFISASTRADDGMQLSRLRQFFAPVAEQLPDESRVTAELKTLVEELAALRLAPLTEPFTGPALFSGRATSVFFHEVLGHRVEGSKLKNVRVDQTFKEKLGSRILPDFMSVHSDPTLREFAGISLRGHYAYDNEGVQARRVPIVESGVLKNFLMARTPIAGFTSSNGHGRRQPGSSAASRQSNLLVTTTKPVPQEQLKQQLLDLVRSQGKPYGLLFDDIVGGVTQIGRTSPSAFNVMPVLVYRIYPDGRQELVRGVNLVGTPLTAISKIVALDDRPDVFNGTCGAESGNVPVSAVAPGMLISQVETQRTATSQQRPPLLPNPIAPNNKE